MTAFQIGALVGPYRIVGELGGGGMGMVYRAVHQLLQRPAALKVLRPELGGYPVAGDRFLTEARATTAIRHPGIVEVYDYGHTDTGDAYIAMELLEGQTLGARIARGPLAVTEALTIARRIAAPLAAAHERGIVHRDLKPDNVFLVPDHEGGAIDNVKLLDFGIAKLDGTARSRRTTVGMVMGTPEYMSPEQCRGIECDHRTDLYALGCIVFEMLTGRTPFGALPAGELLAAHVYQRPPDLAELAAVPPRVAILVARLLAKELRDRPRSALDVVAELDRELAEAAPVEVVRSRGSLRTALLAATGIAISLSVIGAWYRSWRTGTRATVAVQLPAPLAGGTDAGLGQDAGFVAPQIITHDDFDDAPTNPRIRIEAPPRRSPPPPPAKRPSPSPDAVVLPPREGSASGGVDTVVIDVD